MIKTIFHNKTLVIYFCILITISCATTDKTLTISERINRGNEYVEKYDYNRAIREYTAVLRIQPNNFEALEGRGLAYGIMGDFERAGNDFDAALALRDDSLCIFSKMRVSRYLSTLGFMQKDYDRASNAAAKLYYFRAYSSMVYFSGFYNDNLRYSNSVNINIIDETILAIENFTIALMFQPVFYEALVRRGLLYYTLNYYNRAIEDFNSALEIQNDARLLLRRGNAYFLKGDYIKAFNDYNSSILLKPDLIEAIHARGYMYLQFGDYDRAINDFTEAIELWPMRNTDNFHIYYRSYFRDRSQAYYNKGDYDRAKEDEEIFNKLERESRDNSI